MIMIIENVYENEEKEGLRGKVNEV